MKRFYKYIIPCFLFLIFSSCVTTGFNDFYQPWYEENYFPEDAYLKEQENPEIIQTSDLDSKFREVSSNWYWCIGYSGFNGAVGSGEVTSGIDFPPSKYYDLYFQSQFNGGIVSNMMLCTIETCGGHALKETAQWYNDVPNFVNQEQPWFVRGSGHLDGALAGAFSSYNGSGGAPYDNLSWRSVLIVGDGA